MKVRIVKCNNKLQWYSNQIGSIINVKMHSDGANYAAEFVGQDITHFILAVDCEIIEADEPKPEPFDLERALKGEKVVTMDGRNVSEVCQIKTLKSDANIIVVCDGGFTFVDSTGLSLYNEWSVQMAPRAPEYQTVWVNLYDEPFNEGRLGNGYAFHKKDDAIGVQAIIKDNKYIGTFPITFKKP